MKLKDLFKDRGSWTQGVMARDRSGKPVPVKSKSACKFCLLGGLIKCYPNMVEVENRVVQHIGNTIPNWNDSATFEELTALINELDI